MNDGQFYEDATPCYDVAVIYDSPSRHWFVTKWPLPDKKSLIALSAWTTQQDAIIEAKNIIKNGNAESPDEPSFAYVHVFGRNSNHRFDVLVQRVRIQDLTYTIEKQVDVGRVSS